MAKIVKFHPSLLHCIGAARWMFEGWVGFGDGGRPVKMLIRAPIPPPAHLNQTSWWQTTSTIK